MRRLGGIFLIHVLLFPQIAQAYLVTDYVVNWEAIEDAFCENKERPELECHGSCHLQKEIVMTTGADQDAPQSPTIYRLSEFFLSWEDFDFTFCEFPQNIRRIGVRHSVWESLCFDTPSPPPKILQ
ncbi:MAG: hypothetical protein HWE14_02480 [Flavobacteriia bacterium]|nr:hypothetical protein [Flavobacteriia bacterium]